MEAAELVRRARASSRRTHRALAVDAGVATSTITRVQGGYIDPTVGVLDRLLESCGYELRLVAVPRGSGASLWLGDLADAWVTDREGERELAWTRWRAWLDHAALHPTEVPEAIYVPPPPAGWPVADALLAAVAEKLADDGDLPRPSWTSGVPSLDQPFEPRARRRSPVPDQLAARGLLIGASSLFRAGAVDARA